MDCFFRLPGDKGAVAQLCIRVMLGIVMFPHGAQKAFGWFQGPGLQGTLDAFASMGFPQWSTYILIFLESGGALLLAAGLLTRVWALGFLVSISVCMALNHVQHGFFMNWYGQLQGEGYEYHLLVIGISLALIVGGGGRYSFDHRLCAKAGSGAARLDDSQQGR
ncbi:MAG: DoxX family protein [Desulfobulbaceae bacterium]